MTTFARAAKAGRVLLDDLKVIESQFGRQDIFFHAGSVAYSALLAGVPFLLLVASAIGYLLGAAPATSNDTLERFLQEMLPDRTAAAALPLVRGILIDVEAKRSAVGLVGAPLFAWFSTRFFGAMRSSLSSVFNVERGRGIIQGKLYDLLYVLVGTVLVSVYLAINAYLGLGTQVGGAFGRAVGLTPDTEGFLWFFLGRMSSTGFLAVMFTGLYKFLPNRHVGWESAVWGGVWGALLFEVARNVIFQFVTRSMNPASLYSGALAAIVVIVFWAYYAAVIFLIGGVVARVHEVRGGRSKLSKAEVAALTKSPPPR